MSGIFAYIGSEEPRDVLITGLSKMQHRGGEVNGVSVKAKDGFATVKTVGDLQRLSEEGGKTVTDGCCGIAETSHQLRCVGALSTVPASNGFFSAVCDGPVLNFHDLKRRTKADFDIATDEDLIAASLCFFDTDNKIERAFKAAELFRGGPGFAFISKDESSVFARAGNKPFFVGAGDGGMYVSSELAALFGCCEKYAVLLNGESVKLRSDRALFFDAKCRKTKKSYQALPSTVRFETALTLQDKLYGCSLAVREIWSHYVKNSKLCLDSLHLTKRSVEKLSKIILTGEGSSYFSALYARHLLELQTDIPSYAYASGEFMHAKGVIDKNTLLIAVSDRGETPSTLSCVRRAKQCGAKTLAVTGSGTSALAFMCDTVLTTDCDSTRGISFTSFIAGSVALSLLSLFIGQKDDVVTDIYLSVALKMTEMLSGKIATAIKNSTAVSTAATIIDSAQYVFAAGTGLDYAASLEAADKIREVAGINCTAMPLSELVNVSPRLLSDSAVI
ncbi:MAG: SIS domain-containing protein, partial [Ruminococcaceae bacterium]|nr:SIS domain-containing protein [Oscillospiraceae bacterium]